MWMHIVVKTSDGDLFVIEESVAFMSQTLTNMIVNGQTANVIQLLPNITSRILTKVIEYCKKHLNASAFPREDTNTLKNWEAEFINVDEPTLFNLSQAAYDLAIIGLLKLTREVITELMKGKSSTEEAKIRRENPWAFD